MRSTTTTAREVNDMGIQNDIDCSDMKINVYSHTHLGEDWELVCSIPINDITGAIRWHSTLPETPTFKGGKQVGSAVEEGWEMVKEDAEGQHWILPEHEVDTGTSTTYTEPERSVLIETHEQFMKRREKVKAANIEMVHEVAKTIRKMYLVCGDFWDAECTVQVTQEVEI